MSDFVFTVDNCRCSDERYKLIELLRFSEPTIAGWQYAGRVRDPHGSVTAVVFRSDGSTDAICGNAIRLIPIPQRRPWSKPEDVPGGVVWLEEDAGDCLILRITDDGVFTRESFLLWDELQDMHYSHDRKTWQPCEVES